MQLQFPTGSNHLTKADARILDYISQNTEEVLFLSIGQLANRLQLADATVSRFVRHVGCADYRELRQLVKRQSAAGPGPAAKMAETLNRETGFTLDAWMRRQQLLLQKTLEELRSDQFAQAVRAVQEARHVWIHAKNASASPGQLLFFRARRLGIPVTLLPSGGSELLEGLAQVQKDDLVILFCLSKLSREGQTILDYSREAGFRTLSFSGRSYVPADEQADINLFVSRGEPNEYHSMTAPSALVDALIVALSESMGTEAGLRLERLHQLKEKYAAKQSL